MTDDELKQLFDSVRQEDAAAQAETRKRSESAIQHFDNRSDLLVESIVALGEKLDRKFSALEERMERGFAETQALIRSTWRSTI